MQRFSLQSSSSSSLLVPHHGQFSTLLWTWNEYFFCFTCMCMHSGSPCNAALTFAMASGNPGLENENDFHTRRHKNNWFLFLKEISFTTHGFHCQWNKPAWFRPHPPPFVTGVGEACDTGWFAQIPTDSCRIQRPPTDSCMQMCPFLSFLKSNAECSDNAQPNPADIWGLNRVFV